MIPKSFKQTLKPTRIVSAHESHRDGEQRDGQNSVASSEGGSYEEDSRERERECRVQLSGVGDSEIFFVDAPVAEDTENHRANPHRDVRERRVETVLFDVELQHFRHVLGQVCHHREVSDSMADLRADSGKLKIVSFGWKHRLRNFLKVNF